MAKFIPRKLMVCVLAGSVGTGALGCAAQAQERLPWLSGGQSSGQPSGPPAQYQGRNDEGPYNQRRNDGYAASQPPPYQQAQGQAPDPYSPKPYGAPAPNDAYRPNVPANRYDYGQPATGGDRYAPQQAPAYRQPPPRYVEPYRAPQQQPYPRYGADDRYGERYGNYDGDRREGASPRMPDSGNATYSENEVVDAGHRFFGSLSNGLAKAIQWAFKKSGRPNGYILGEDAGGAFIAGLRYGEGKLYTKHHGVRRVFWQGPSVGYDFGGDGNRTMTLVYNLRSPNDVYRRFGGVQGSAYLVGGASVQFLTADNITLAPIRTGVGLRLGANIGYLKFTRRPTWNPF